jgi:general L-amino acid transport system substrate-binding protein
MRARFLLTLLAALTAGLMSAALPAGEILDGVKARGYLRCGVSEGIAGFAERNAAGHWQGMEVDFCRAVAAAVLGDPAKVRFVPLRASTRFPALQANRIDLLLRNTTWTLTREALLDVQFPGILFYDGQGLLVPASAGIGSADDLDGATVCVEQKTTHEQRLLDFFALRGLTVKPLVIDSFEEVAKAFFAGRCDAYTSDVSQLAATRIRAPGGAGGYLILPERISHQPLAPVVRDGDAEWVTLVRWVLFALIATEHQGLTSANIDTMLRERDTPAARLVSGLDDRLSRALKVPADWMAGVVRAVGNYGEMYERHFGPDSELPIDRGLNNLWIHGGLMYAPPID